MPWNFDNYEDGFKFHDNAFNLLRRSDTSIAYRV